MKYIIEIEDKAVNECNEKRNALFKAKNFKTLVFDEVGLSKLTPLADAIGDIIKEEREEAYNIGYDKGYEIAHAECVARNTRSYNDGFDAGEEELKGIVLGFIRSMVKDQTENKCKPEVRIFDSCEDCVHFDKPHWANPCNVCKHSHEDFFERKTE